MHESILLNRRRWLLAAPASLLALSACSESEDARRARDGQPPLTPEQRRLRHKFKGLRGGQLVVDAFGEKHAVTIFDEEGRVFYTRGIVSRIPDDLLEDLRRDPKGVLRLKLRIHPDTLLVGWDIERRPGFDLKKRDQFGEAVYVAPVHSFAGGDFREAKIFNGQAVRMGWYIHPKTGERIETDF